MARMKRAVSLMAILAATLVLAGCGRQGPKADPQNADQVATGKRLYEQYCASCHGANLEGQPGWRARKPDGKLPAPPHDQSGHTWHHPDHALFGLVKNGMKPYAGANYQSDMPAFGGTLTDEQIWDVLAYIKSRWPERIQKAQEQMGK
jgi:mono/diheme cytochrome c family protein